MHPVLTCVGRDGIHEMLELMELGNEIELGETLTYSWVQAGVCMGVYICREKEVHLVAECVV